jgi:ribonuclease-3 family protein
LTELFNPQFTDAELGRLSVLGLAHVGDGVYELLTRTMLCSRGLGKVNNLHRATVELVKAPAQAKAMEKILPLLTEQEAAVYRRGRNTKTHAAPNRATASEYHAATGLETLFGWLYLKGERARLSELYAYIMEEN